jgi:response regulator RpfG family c-di-GMP phosphodiesterase
MASPVVTSPYAAVTVVEDEPHVRDVMVRAIRSWNYDCQDAGNAEQALALLEVRPTPVVVTDLRMPGQGGVWLTRETLRRWPTSSVIVVTAGGEMDAVTKCLDAGAQHYFLKPIHFDEFQHALAATLRAHQERREGERRRHRLERDLEHHRGRLRHAFLSAVTSLVRTLEARDAYTSGHSFRVRSYGLRLANRLQLDETTKRRLSLAAKLHDIGKIALPESVLNKESRLTVEEYAMVMEHPEIGERILRPIIRNREILAGIRGHHERYDGGGYPDGLRGESIPLLGRIIAVADCFDALTSRRAYRQPLPGAAALELIRQRAGTQFDPKLAAAFVEMFRARKDSDYPASGVA